MKSVFVSSTFKDMNYERDILNRRVAPKINYQLSKYNQNIRIIDLRWGIDTSDMSEQDASKRVLSTCFKAIEECKPYVIVLIGDRYGYIPEDHDISVTHMEILRGVFESAEKNHIHVYFRDCDYSDVPDEVKDQYIEQTEASKQLLAKLKDDLQRELPHCCKHYKAKWSAGHRCLVSDEFENLIVADLEADILGETEGICYRSDLHKQICENEELLAEHIQFAYTNETKIDLDIEEIERANVPYGIIGDGGTGKSIYMSLLCSALRKRGYRTHILFCGDNAFSASMRNAAEMVLFMLAEACNEEYHFEEYAALTYDEIVPLIIKKRSNVKNKSFLILDAIDKCDRGMANFIYWCSSFLSEQIHIVFSSRMIAELNAQKESFIVKNISHSREDFRGIIRCILSQYAKSISDVHMELLLDKARTPIQLHLVLLRLLDLRASDFEAIQKLGGGIDAINEYLAQVINNSPAEIEELISEYLKTIFEEFKNPRFAMYLLNLLSCCEYGLHEDDIRALFDLSNTEWISLDYIEFLEQFGFFVRIRDNGRLDISHDIIRKTLSELFDRSKEMICFLISMHFLYKEKQNAVTIRTFVDAAYKGKQFNRFLEFVKKFKIVSSSSEISHSVLAEEIRRAIQELYFKDDGRFLFTAVNSCRSVEEVVYFQMIISSSLLSINDYYDEETVLKIVYAVMLIPSQLNLLSDDLLEMEIISCERFLKRHCVAQSKINEFRDYCEKVMRKYKNDADAEKKNDGNLIKATIKELHNAKSAEKTTILFKLSKTAREMAGSQDTAKEAEEIALELIDILQNETFIKEEGLKDTLYADIYTTFGLIYKTLGEWEKSISYDKLSIDIYKKLYDQNPSAIVFKKYRERVYNLANVTEAWAISEKNNAELWNKAKECYEEAYALELTAISHGVPERDILYSASSILGLGTSLINLGKYDEGKNKYKEGIALITNSAKNNCNPDLYTELCIHLINCVCQLLTCEKQDAARELSSDIGSYISLVIESGSLEMTDQIKDVCIAFSEQINDIVKEAHDCSDIEVELTAYRILYDMYKAILPIAPHAVKVNIIITKCNICAILFWKLKDYSRAYDEYQELLKYAEEQDLTAKDENGHYVDEANGRLADAYVRSLLCLEKLGRVEELKSLIDEAPKWAEYIANHMNVLEGDAAYVLYTMSIILSRNDSPLGILLLMMAFEFISDDNCCKKVNPETAALIINEISKIKGNEEN